MPRLPDIPDTLWKTDQQQEFDRITSGRLPALDFELATQDLESEELTPVISVYDDEARYQELKTAQAESESEEDRRRREESDVMYQTYLNKAKAQQEQQDAATQEAAQVGIITPDQFTDDIYKQDHRPGTTVNNSASAVYGAPLEDEGIMDPQSFESQLRGTAQAVGDFVVNAPSNIADTIGNAPQRIADNFTQTEPTTDFSGQPTEAQPIPDVPFTDTGLYQTGKKLVEDVGTAVATDREAIRAREAAGYPALVNPDNPQDTGYGTRPILSEETRSQEAQRKAVSTALGTPLQAVGDVIDILAGDPKQEIKRKDPWGVLDTLGMSEGITVGDVIANVAPFKWLQLPQYIDVGRQLIEAPGETAAGLSILGGLAGLMHMGPKGRSVALGIIGAVAGGIDAAMNDRDITTEAAGGALAIGTLNRSLPAVARVVKEIATSRTVADAARYLDELAAKVADDALEGIRPRYPAVAQAVESAPVGWDVVETGVGRAAGLARDVAAIRAPIGASTGGVVGATAGAMAGDEDDSLVQRAAKITAGAGAGLVVGRFAAREGTVAAGKAVDSLIARGMLDPNLLEFHPEDVDRVRALFAMAAQDKPDNAPIDTPAMVRAIAKMGPEIRQQIPEFFQDGLTAGDIRGLVNEPGMAERIYNQSTGILVDVITGLRHSRQRGRELSADRATVFGLDPGMAYDLKKAVVDPNPEILPTEWRSPYGGAPMKRVEGPEWTGFMKEHADDLGMPTPALYIVREGEANAAATLAGKGTNRRRVVMITSGLLDIGLTRDELGAIIKHEMAHIAQYGNKADAARIGVPRVVPPAVVDQMARIPVGRLDPEVIRSIERKGGTYDPETGVTAGVTRAQSRIAAGGKASRGGPFYEPVRPGEGSTYYTPDEQTTQGSLGGSEELPRTITRYRNPLIMRRGQNGETAYNNALRQLDIPSGASTVESEYRFQIFDPQTGNLTGYAATEQAAKEISAQYGYDYEDSQSLYLTHEFINNELMSIRESTRIGSPARTRALKELLIRYGGNPDDVDTMQMVARDTEESGYAIVENIIATNARRKGHDAAFLMGYAHIDYPALEAEPEYQLLKDQAKAIQSEYYDWEDEQGLFAQLQAGTIDQDMYNQRIKEYPGILKAQEINRRIDALEQKHAIPEWQEIMAIREDRNPVPAPDHPDFPNQQNQGEVPKIGRPGYSIHSDIDLPEGTVRRTFDEPVIQPEDHSELVMARERLDRAQQDRAFLRKQWYDKIEDPAFDRESKEARDLLTRIVEAQDEEVYSHALVTAKQRDLVGKPEIIPPEWKPFPGSENFAAGAASSLAAAEGEDDEDERDWSKILAAGVVGGAMWARKSSLANPAHVQNNPTFRMLKNIGEKPRQTNIGLIESVRNGVVKLGFDSLGTLQRYQDDVAKVFKDATGHNIPARFLVAELKRFDPHKAAAQFVDDNLKPAIVAVRDLGIDEDRVDNYLMQTMYRDVGRYLGNYNNTGRINYKRSFPGGVNAVDAENYLLREDSELRQQLGPEGFKKFSDAMQNIWDTGDKILQIKRDSGLIEGDMYTTLREAYPHYVPTNVLAYITDSANVGMGKSLSQTSNTIHELSRKGTDKPAMGAMASMVAASYEAMAASQKNRVFNAFVSLWSEASRLTPQLPMQEAERMGTTAIRNTRQQERVSELADLVVPWSRSKSVRGATPTDANPEGMNPEWNALEGFVDGHKIKFAVHKDLGDITKFDSPVHIPLLSEGMALFRATATSRNPVFLMSNAALDAANYAIREGARNNGNYYEVSKAYIRSMWGTLLDPRVWQDIARNEFKGDAGRFLRGNETTIGGGGYSGHTPRSNYIPQGRLDTDSQNWWERTVAKAMRGAGFESESASQAEVRRLRQDVGAITGGVGTIGGGVAGGAAGAQTIDEDDTRGTRFGKIAAGAVAGSVTGTVGVGKLEARNARDMLRIFGDIWTLKPVERIGERIELIPRAASMRLAEGRYAGPLSRTGQEIEGLTAAHEAVRGRIAQAARKNPNRGVPKYLRKEAGDTYVPLSQARGELEDLTQRRDIEAIQSGRTVTVDFNKGGTWSKGLNQIVPFFNVGMQSLADIPRMYHEKPKMTATLLTALTFPSLAAEVFNNRDERTRKDYDDVPEYDRNSGLIIMLPNEGQGVQVPVDDRGNRHPQYIHIRYRQFAPIAIMAREFLQGTIFRDPNSDMAKGFSDALLTGSNDPLSAATGALGVGAQALGAVSPVQARDAGGAITNMLPPLVGTAVQSYFDQDTFRNRKIVSQAADENASPLSQMLAENFGGDETRRHASWWEWATRDVLTGQAGMWHGASQIAAGDETKRYSPMQDAPVTGGITSRVQKGGIGQLADNAREDILTPSAEKILVDNKILWRPSPAEQEISNIPLTRREYAEYQKEVNRVTDEVIQKVSRQPGWNTYSADDKQKRIEANLNAQREGVRGKILQTIPETERQRRLRAERKKSAERR